MRQLDSWDRGFESGSGHGSDRVFVGRGVGSGFCDELITRSGESYQVCVCLILCELETSKRGCLGPSWATAPQEKK
jgi:hypothetical protein